MFKVLKNVFKNPMTYVMLFLISEPAMAITGQNNFGTFFGDTKLQTGITIGFGLYAFWKWIGYFTGFNPDSALSNIVAPAILTFLTFNWDTVVGWFGFK